MPLLTRTMIKVGLVYLVAALLANLLVAVQPFITGLPPGIATLRPVALHLLTVGWLTQLIFGVIYWMFPKVARERPRGSERLGWATFWLLNAGLLLRVAGEPLVTLRPTLQGDASAGWLLVASSLLQLVAGLAFIANTWARVKER